MKKTLFLAVTFLAMSANMLADGLTATLQQGDKMTPFYGIDAFKKAYEAADSGAVITLSSGQFNTVDSVAKSMTIIGAYAFKVSDPTTTILSNLNVRANNVKVEGIYFSGSVSLGAITNCHIKRCWIQLKLSSSAAHTNTLIDQCVVKNDYAVSKGINYCIKNSTIDYFGAMNTTSNIAYITNCVVWNWYSSSSNQPYAIYKNNVLACWESGSRSIEASAYSEFYNNLFINRYNSTYIFTVTFPSGCINSGNINDKNYSAYYTTSDKSYPAPQMKAGATALGQDGTPIGIYGGTGFSEYPSIPRITSKTIDSSTDAGGKLNVKIAVKVEQ